MAESISKRTFFEGCTIELFKRNDGEHRIKFAINGDEITLNYGNRLHKGFPTDWFEEIAYADRLEAPEGFNGTGSGLPHNRALWALLINSNSYFKNIISQMGKSMVDGEAGISMQKPLVVWVYTKGDFKKIFTNPQEADDWIEANDPEGVAFEHTLV